MTKRTTPRGNLPADLTAFVGRRDLLDTAGPLLSRSRLVTLLGPGGVGKTRTAIRLGRTHPLLAPGGVWLVDLADLDEAALVPNAVADALGIHDQSQRPILDTITEHVRERGDLLLILDNCEHVTPVVAELADTLLRGAPGVRILATSRHPLGVLGERSVPVEPMSVPTPAELAGAVTLDAIDHHDAVRLFLDRAADAGAVISDQDAEAIGRLVRRVEGVPLAIELAAARTARRSVADVLAHLDDPLRTLAGTGRVSHPPHHASVDATLTWSYQQCTPAEQRLLARLSVFTGGFDLAAAQAVCADDLLPAQEILDVIEGLADHSLITIRRTGADSRHLPYRMLETVRAYGRARLAEHGEQARFQQRHRNYYRTLTTQLLHEWFSPRELDWMDWVRREMPNIRTALSNAVLTGDADTGLIIDLNLSRSRVWFLVASLPESRYWLRTLLALNPDTGLRVLVMATGAWIASCQGDRRAALSIIADCLRAGRNPEPGSEDITATVIAFAKGAYQLFCGTDFAGAAAHCRRARDGLLRAGLPGDAHMAEVCMTIAAAADSHPQTAFRAAEECSANADASGAQWAASWAQWTHGLVELRHGDPEKALLRFRAGLRVGHSAGDNWGPAWSLASIGWAFAALGEHEQAAVLMAAADRQLQRIGIDTTRLAMLATLSRAAVAEARAALGAAAFATASARGAEMDYHEAVATALGEAEAVTTNSAERSRQTGQPEGRRAGNSAETAQLTDREWEVARLLSADAGLSNQQLAGQLCVTVRTVEAHMSHIIRKLGVTSRAEVAVWAITHTRRVL
jgi:predicted ATPase/DNA-binding NarL/FixJ family response regulator